MKLPGIPPDALSDPDFEKVRRQVEQYEREDHEERLRARAEKLRRAAIQKEEEREKEAQLRLQIVEYKRQAEACDAALREKRSQAEYRRAVIEAKRAEAARRLKGLAEKDEQWEEEKQKAFTTHSVKKSLALERRLEIERRHKQVVQDRHAQRTHQKRAIEDTILSEEEYLLRVKRQRELDRQQQLERQQHEREAERELNARNRERLLELARVNSETMRKQTQAERWMVEKEIALRAKEAEERLERQRRVDREVQHHRARHLAEISQRQREAREFKEELDRKLHGVKVDELNHSELVRAKTKEERLEHTKAMRMHQAHLQQRTQATHAELAEESGRKAVLRLIDEETRRRLVLSTKEDKAFHAALVSFHSHLQRQQRKTAVLLGRQEVETTKLTRKEEAESTRKKFSEVKRERESRAARICEKTAARWRRARKDKEALEEALRCRRTEEEEERKEATRRKEEKEQLFKQQVENKRRYEDHTTSTTESEALRLSELGSSAAGTSPSRKHPSHSDDPWWEVKTVKRKSPFIPSSDPPPFATPESVCFLEKSSAFLESVDKDLARLERKARQLARQTEVGFGE